MNLIRKNSVIGAMTFLLTSVVCAQSSDAMSGLKVNGQSIDPLAFETMLEAAKKSGASDGAQLRGVIRDELVARQLFLQEAASRGLEKAPENQRVLQQVRDNALIELLMADEIKRHPVDDAAIRTEYDRQVAELRGVEETRLQAMVFKTEAEAKEVVAKLKKGEAFDKLAREKSIDPSKEQGGLVGWVLPTNVVPQLSAVMTNLPKGGFSLSPVQTNAGWHVIRVDDRRPFKVPSLEESRGRIAAGLLQRQRMQLLTRLAAAAKFD